MTHIVFDLEWNQKKYKTAVRSIGEIIEIGAVRLNEEMEITGTFSRVVKPSIYPALHPYVMEMVHITEEELAKGDRFEDVYRDFRDFCGEAPVFYSWGYEDMEILMQNMAYFGMPIGTPPSYYDLQKIYAEQFDTQGQAQRSLAWCVEQMQIEEQEGEYHRALTDASYTAQIMKRLDMDAARQTHKGKYLPSGHQLRSHQAKYRSLVEPSQGFPKCPVCHATIRAFPDMFSFTNNSIIVVCMCSEHGYFSTIVSRKRSTPKRSGRHTKQARV